MKSCRIDKAERDKALATIGIALTIGALLAYLIDGKISLGIFLVVLGLGVWSLLIGVCKDG